MVGMPVKSDHVNDRFSVGSTGITTSTLALGCSRLGSALTPLGKRESIAFIQRAYALGVRHFDTASIYGQGDSERLLGEALQGQRAEVCLSSKAGQLLTTKQAVLAHFKPAVRWLAARRQGLRSRVAQARAIGVPRCFEPDFIERSLNASLKRLRTDHLDLFYLHSPDIEVLDDGALFERLDRLQRRGLFKALGVSCDELALARRAAAHDRVQVVQFEFDGSAEARALVAEMAERAKPAVLRGLLKWRTQAALPGNGENALVHGFQHALELPGRGGVLIGTTSAEHLQENIAAFRRASQLQHSHDPLPC